MGINVYIEKQGAPELPYSLVFWPNYRFPISPKRLFLSEIMEAYEEPFFCIVDNIEEADFVAVPHEYFFVETQFPRYLSQVFELAKSVRKKVLLFDYTDWVDRTAKLPEHAILFRVSVYRHHKKENEIVMPYFVEDIGDRYKILPREKGEKPIVGYCGQAQFGSKTKKFRAVLKRLLSSFLLLLRWDKNPSVHTRGIFWRSKALRVLRGSSFACNFVERPFYSMHQNGVTVAPSQLRHEYVENLRESDLALCVRGDSNTSQRFYETLSSTRIPLFVDTDCVLPLEEIISYDRVILRVPSRSVKVLEELVRKWWNQETVESFKEKGEDGLSIYKKYLRLDSFFKVVFDRKNSPYKKILF
ncbi:MAG: hypothetical protein COV91_01030 [Candidatus Taylorbacteria bacterium CG11_big_fil_rev_8_21_14_0_20_46_11]|uniref:Exostosin GT47 domain-containing protein n=1 Tax=Candidatus Taylorbacteria bacterium CG11_big_fil_rev_8_21_14_0_20_46_11 TaxID=1975025 RepID=A0A2H0KCR8_9BACT|nr:MAG: hypothetical protein COV91_01030 [Candidatus Taylorbacteria bacterium CG11_big_fil_rev_8_21_14_0_20_46_11]